MELKIEWEASFKMLKLETTTIAYLGHLVSHGPVNDEANGVSNKEDHGDMAKPDVILYTRLRCEPNKRQNWRSSGYRKEEKCPAYVSNIP